MTMTMTTVNLTTTREWPAGWLAENLNLFANGRPSNIKEANNLSYLSLINVMPVNPTLPYFDLELDIANRTSRA